MSDTTTGETPEILVRYSHNLNPSHATSEVSFPDDDRPALKIGELGYVTKTELAQAGAVGVVLIPTTEEDAEALNLTPPEQPEQPEVISGDLGEARLKEIAELDGVDLTGKRSNDAKAQAILEHRELAASGPASLPATAPQTGTPAPGSQSGGGQTSSSGGDAGTAS